MRTSGLVLAVLPAGAIPVRGCGPTEVEALADNPSSSAASLATAAQREAWVTACLAGASGDRARCDLRTVLPLNPGWWDRLGEAAAGAERSAVLGGSEAPAFMGLDDDHPLAWVLTATRDGQPVATVRVDAATGVVLEQR